MEAKQINYKHLKKINELWQFWITSLANSVYRDQRSSDFILRNAYTISLPTFYDKSKDSKLHNIFECFKY